MAVALAAHARGEFEISYDCRSLYEDTSREIITEGTTMRAPSLLLVLFFTPALHITASADVFDQWFRLHNDQRPMTVLEGEALQLYQETWAKIDGASTVLFPDRDGRRWAGDVGLGRMRVYMPGQPDPYNGWMALQLSKTGRVRSMIWTYSDPPESWTAHDGEWGQAADAATTLAGIGAGFAEANPTLAGVPPHVAGVAKVALIHYLSEKSLQSCVNVSPAVGIGWGAAAWNAAVMVGAGPAAAAPAIAVAISSTPDTDEAVWDCLWRRFC